MFSSSCTYDLFHGKKQFYDKTVLDLIASYLWTFVTFSLNLVNACLEHISYYFS